MLASRCKPTLFSHASHVHRDTADFTHYNNCCDRICWPFSGDQPYNAAHLSENLKVALELVEVRTGECGVGVNGKTKPLHRSGRAAQGTRAAVRAEFLGVIDAVRGEKGAEIRANTQRLKSMFNEAWEQGGDAREQVRAFLKEFVLKG